MNTPAPKPGPILSLSDTHKMIANWILANPGGTYRQMQAVFPYSIPWLCQVVKSDLFQAYMGERLKSVNAAVDQDIPAMLRGTAVLAIERLNGVLEKTEDAKTIVDAFDSVLHRYGFAPNAKAAPAAQQPLVQQNNVFYLGREDLKEVRGELLNAHRVPQAPAPALPAADEVVIGPEVPAAE